MPANDSNLPVKKYQKLDDDEHAWCIKNGLYFICREQGHKSSDCPKSRTHETKAPVNGVYSIVLGGESTRSFNGEPTWEPGLRLKIVFEFEVKPEDHGFLTQWTLHLRGRIVSGFTAN